MLFKDFYFLHVSISTHLCKLIFDLASIKDAWTVQMILESLNEGFDYSRQSLEPKSKARTKQIVFLAAYVFEDIGQVLCQYIYYEQFATRKSLFSLVNGFVMILLAIPTVKLVFRYNVRTKKELS